MGGDCDCDCDVSVWKEGKRMRIREGMKDIRRVEVKAGMWEEVRKKGIVDSSLGSCLTPVLRSYCPTSQ